MSTRNKVLTLALLVAGCVVFAQGGKEAVSKKGEIPKLTFLTNVNVDTEGYDVNESPYLKFIEDKFGVDIEIITESTQYQEKLNATMASGNLPDYVNILKKADLQRWASEGLLMPLDDLLKKCPNLQSQIMPLAWSLSTYDGDNKIYGVPLLRYDSTPLMTYARKDWMDKLGIKPEDVKTTDDWYNLLYKFVHDDPDGNGKNDTMGLASRNNDYSAVYLTFPEAFNGACDQIIDGKVIPNYLTPGYKDYLKYMQKLYVDGLVDQQYLVTSSQQMWEKIRDGKVGAFLGFWMLTELRSLNVDISNFYPIEPPLRSDGTRSFYRYGSPIRTYTAISATCKNPEKVMEILDWAATEEGGIFVFAGIEGLDWNRDASGNIVIKPERRGKNTSLRFILLGAQKPKIDTPVLESLMAQSWGEAGLNDLAVASRSGGYDEIEMVAPYFPELAVYDIDSQVKEFRDLAIMGKIDIDKEWDGYVKKILDAGASQKIRLMTDWYNKNHK
jgi:putative aldouronate transport system substrate-binding protein